ncbi:hydroxymethylglutaryl-CoA synthase [Leuconostoc litchii]|uniref:Hydroxymethylglutaryl-CoA synthase n=1 Tax=Leuconostoc litchii TaxID=1981069 RepID=A0A6P2CPM5_9LACO|nr:hydroxymethylglutaryl-CoA synthase [Leuconostoc litchii]TYC46921.1 hydroxymethylglutaryl-CoA synthase [Leuconostoc litchii]
MTIGIDKLSFYTSEYVLDLVDLAQKRGDDPDKYTIGIGQDKQAVIPNYEDVVTMGANAAVQIVEEDDRKNIDMIIFATESGIDNSKSSALYVQKLLKLSEFSRTIEIKQACYAGTYGVMQARDYVATHPDKRVLVIASDIARYGLGTPGEVTQGGGAIAMIIAKNPKIAAINPDSVYMSQDVADFWRPIDRSEAIVDGHLSTDIYKEMFLTLWKRYQQQTGYVLDDFLGFAFHLPYTKMGKKAFSQIINEANESRQELLSENLIASQKFSRDVGNLYTGSVYLSLLSLLTYGQELAGGDRLAIFSYGSGAEAELYSITLQENFHEYVLGNVIEKKLAKRIKVSVDEYEKIFSDQLYDSHRNVTSDFKNKEYFEFLGWKNGERQYN